MPRMHARLIEVASDVLQIDIPSDTDDLRRSDREEWDSVNHLRLIMELEDAFGITIEDEQAMELSSLRQIESLLIERGAISFDRTAG